MLFYHFTTQVDFCNWKSNAGTYERDSPSTQSMKIPAIDHTLGAADGHYIKVSVPNQDVTLNYTIPPDVSVSHTLPVTLNPRPMCLKFWYYFGAPAGTVQMANDYFKVSTSKASPIVEMSAPIVRSYLNGINQWLYKRVSFKLEINGWVSISAHTSGPNSVIAFDDIQIQKQYCEQPGWCDFENGTRLVFLISLVF